MLYWEMAAVPEKERLPRKRYSTRQQPEEVFMQTISQILAEELQEKELYIKNVIDLLDEGNTIPFIARYRKEVHGGMEDTKLRTLEERLKYLRGLDERRQTVLSSIAGQEKLTPELQKAIEEAKTLAELEDLYRPYRPKRRTRALIAREKGLGPLAERLLAQKKEDPAPEELAKDFVDPEKGVNSVEEALQGASDIAAEEFSDRADLRQRLKDLISRDGMIVTAAATEEDTVYSMYYDFSSKVNRIKGHQVLAINRGEREKCLKVSLELERQKALYLLWNRIIRRQSAAEGFLKAAAEDAYDRLIFPSLEREIRSTLTDSASEGAIEQFAANLKPLLMQPPVKGSVTMGLDPGYAHGCKVAVVDATGRVLDTTVVYPTFGKKQEAEAVEKLLRFVKKYKISHIAIGNGTASRETEAMAVKLVKEASRAGLPLSYMIVSEAGASVYSVGKLASEEFPDYDTNVRSAISIARRMQDPLAELVKIDPKAIGVGQYQHDMPPKRLDETLGNVVEDCVNSVGADLNTASAALLTHISGLTAVTAKNVVAYREENGAFPDRTTLLKVPKLGKKAFQQCAGFLRVPESRNVLDHTAVHPESYKAAEGLLKLTGYTTQDVADGNLKELKSRVKTYGMEKAAEELGVGVPTLTDITDELMQPGRDIRDSLPKPIFRTDVLSMEDLKEGMVMTGTVRNVIDFGVFVDIGVHQDGLVHISQICNKFIKHPSEVLSVGDVVEVKVLSVDLKKKRISLTMKGV